MQDFLSQADSNITQLWQLFNQADHVEALVHMLPAAIGLIGLVLIVILLLSGGRLHGLRWATFLLYAAGAGLVGWMLAQTGEPISWLDHARWIVLAWPAVFVALSAVPKKLIRFTSMVLALIVAIPASGAIGIGVHAVDIGVNAQLTKPEPKSTPESPPENSAQPTENQTQPESNAHGSQSNQAKQPEQHTQPEQPERTRETNPSSEAGETGKANPSGTSSENSTKPNEKDNGQSDSDNDQTSNSIFDFGRWK